MVFLDMYVCFFSTQYLNHQKILSHLKTIPPKVGNWIFTLFMRLVEH